MIDFYFSKQVVKLLIASKTILNQICRPIQNRTLSMAELCAYYQKLSSLLQPCNQGIDMVELTESLGRAIKSNQCLPCLLAGACLAKQLHSIMAGELHTNL